MTVIKISEYELLISGTKRSRSDYSKLLVSFSIVAEAMCQKFFRDSRLSTASSAVRFIAESIRIQSLWMKSCKLCAHWGNNVWKHYCRIHKILDFTVW